VCCSLVVFVGLLKLIISNQRLGSRADVVRTGGDHHLQAVVGSAGAPEYNPQDLDEAVRQALCHPHYDN